VKVGPASVVLLLAGLSTGIVEAACARFEPEITRLEGTLRLRDHAGPPNYESVAAGDRLERHWMLVLDRPLYVAADPDSDLNHEGARRVEEVQLVVMPKSGVDASQHRDRRIRVEGRLFTAHTGHHRTPVLLTVRALSAAAAPRPDEPSPKDAIP
jgi:hypothetical protein